jgi:DNA-binding response OmpR family regulator
VPLPPSILVVGSRRADVFVLEALLAELDRPLLRATTGQEAVRIAVDHEPAVILLEAALPDMDGFEVLSLLRMRRRTRATPVLLHSTSELTREQLRAAMEGGVVDVVHKPFDAEALRARVGALVRLHVERAATREEIDVLRARGRAAEARIAQSELALAAAQARLRMAADAASAGLWDLDPRRGQVRLDAQASRIFGLPQHTLIDAARWLAGVDDAGRARWADQLARAVERGVEAARIAAELVVRDGEHAWSARRVSLRGQTVGDGGGVLVVGIVTEVGPAGIDPG